MPRPTKREDVIEALQEVEEDFTPQELREEIGVTYISKRTVKKYISELVEENILSKTREIGRSKLYEINHDQVSFGETDNE